MSRRVFIGLSGGLGPVMRTLPIADKHREAGDKVAFSIYDEHAATYLQSRGFEHLVDDDPVMPDLALTLPRGKTFYHLDHYYASLGLLDPIFVRSWIRHRIAMLEEFRPELVYADLSPHTIIAARYLGIPVASIVQACFHPNGKSLHYWEEHPRNISKVTPIINCVLEELGLPAIQKMEQLMVGDVTIVPSIPELDSIGSDYIHYVGPIGKDGLPFPSPRSVGACPDVIVYAGRLKDTSGDSGLRLIRLVQDAFRDRPERVALVYTGKLPVETAKAMPESITRVERFEQSWLSQAKLYIHHGGHGSCLSSIMQAIPSLIVPTHSEREYNARRLCELGGGEYVMPDTCLPSHFYALARHVMEDSYRHRLFQLNSAVEARQYGGAEQAYRIARSLRNQLAGGSR
ncbi:UDP:flavonoid glycosyltransferase YjiC (YdhE family) [Paenibacillus cellulosilyticus]|uniref:UDP:flavonoid glycosyltransferase YjiC (YdhE family) n=1 Tax=Paenibacillus cellulosilyticus TaxID=375489 RepID=A0A2V2YU56_9BACL|nr:nucleotide disphospho-sugar-binding domain-containing protein [Paenibacillus cellulosilyticus]PWW03221.1 UDP:flavonoid glycosyltransferase YjiC (YdhE family) [Paenibacillus cellulosilyticus]QKS43710.1 hypothetical protein HUB94_04120 [Paenibacillus cellulosilyticus]